MIIFSGSTPINLDNPSDLPFSFSAHLLPPLHRLPPRSQSQEKSSHWKEKHRSIPRSLFRPILRRWEEQSIGVRHLLGRPRQCQLQHLPEKHLFGGFYFSFSCYISLEFFYETFLFITPAWRWKPLCTRNTRSSLPNMWKMEWKQPGGCPSREGGLQFSSAFLAFLLHYRLALSPHSLALET